MQRRIARAKSRQSLPQRQHKTARLAAGALRAAGAPAAMADSSPEPPLTVTDAQLYGILEGVHEALRYSPPPQAHGAPLLRCVQFDLDLDLSRSICREIL